MHLCQIAYISEAVGFPREEDIRELVAQASAKNERLGLTGCLLFSAGSYLQVLEGPHEPLLETYARIEIDSRHRDVRLLLTHSIASRSFAAWNMGVLNVSELREPDGDALALRVERIRSAPDDAARDASVQALLVEFERQLAPLRPLQESAAAR